MRIQIQHTDAPEEMREVDSEEEAQALADSGLTVLVAGRDGGFRPLERREQVSAEISQEEPQEEKLEEKPESKVVAAVKKAVKKIATAKKSAKKK